MKRKQDIQRMLEDFKGVRNIPGNKSSHFGSRAILAQGLKFVFVDWFACARHGPCLRNHAASSQRLASQLAVHQIQSQSRWMMGTRKAFIQRFAKLAMAQVPIGPCCTSRGAIISHIGIAWTMVSTHSALFAGLICEIFSRSVLKFIVQSAMVLQILKGVVQDAVHLFPCCPRSLVHLSCLASLTPVDDRVWCPTCPEDVRSGVDADWFERQCHINGVDFPADPGCGVCTVCVEEMTVNSSIEVPCCHQRLHVTCLARSFSSRGVDCPFCNQSIAEFARSSYFLASSLFHGCLVDLDVPPSNRGTNSLVLPLGFPRPPR